MIGRASGVQCSAQHPSGVELRAHHERHNLNISIPTGACWESNVGSQKKNLRVVPRWFHLEMSETSGGTRYPAPATIVGLSTHATFQQHVQRELRLSSNPSTVRPEASCIFGVYERFLYREDDNVWNFHVFQMFGFSI